MPVREWSGDAAAGCSREEALVDQERLDHIFQRALVLADRGGERVEPDRPAREPIEDRVDHEPIEPVEARSVDVEPLERETRERAVHGVATPTPFHLREVADAAQQAIRN